MSNIPINKVEKFPSECSSEKELHVVGDWIANKQLRDLIECALLDHKKHELQNCLTKVHNIPLFDSLSSSSLCLIFLRAVFEPYNFELFQMIERPEVH